MSVNKLEQANEHVKLAEKCLKTNLLKWRPDFEAAAEEYNKAATCYRNAKAFRECKEVLLKSVKCHLENQAVFDAAKALDQCILIAKEMSELRDIYEMAERAANLYQSNGSTDRAVSTLEKAAKILYSEIPTDALNLYRHATDIVMDQDNARQAAEYTSKVARIYVKLLQYDLAADAIRREIGFYQQTENHRALGRMVVALVLVQLARGDTVAAEKAFKEWGNYCEDPEMQTLEMLLQAYDEEDPETAKRALNNPFIRSMDVEYAVLTRNIPLPEGGVILQKKPVIANATEEYRPVRPQVGPYCPTKSFTESEEKSNTERVDIHCEDDDEYAGGLC